MHRPASGSFNFEPFSSRISWRFIQKRLAKVPRRIKFIQNTLASRLFLIIPPGRRPHLLAVYTEAACQCASPYKIYTEDPRKPPLSDKFTRQTAPATSPGGHFTFNPFSPSGPTITLPIIPLSEEDFYNLVYVLCVKGIFI